MKARHIFDNGNEVIVEVLTNAAGEKRITAYDQAHRKVYFSDPAPMRAACNAKDELELAERLTEAYGSVFRPFLA